MQTNQELETKFTQLTEQWMNLIGGEHHKDRDCHFLIVRQWSYGQSPYWQVQHYGYLINEYIESKQPSYSAALGFLINRLQEEIKQMKEYKKEEYGN